jgi:hypothetical protein
LASVAIAGLLASMARGGPGSVDAAGVEDFATDPAQRGWRVVGDPSLFRWDAAAGALAVTWDSRRPNSFFALPLPAPLSKADDFSFGFKLRLDEIQPGVDPNKPGTFEIAAGFLDLGQASSPGFQRGVFLRSTNLVEWTWFPSAQGISASVSPAIVPADGRLPWGYRDSYMELETATDYRFRLDYTAVDRTLRLAVQVGGSPGPELGSVVLPDSFTDFSVNALSIDSYSDAGQDPRFAGSILARGWIDDVTWDVPPAPVGAVRIRRAGGGIAVSVGTRTGWLYALQSGADLGSWAPVGEAVAGTGGEIEFAVDPGSSSRFLRVGCRRP